MIDTHAVIDPKAELDEGVSVGPFSIIGPNVRIGKGSDIGPHVVIKGSTTIGEDNRIFQFCSIGEDPQDMKYGGEDTRLEIGDRNTIREFCTLNRGTVQDQGATRIGSDNLLMAYVHVAHDCQIKDHVIMANGVTLAGHITIDDWVILGGFTLIHQFVHIGAHCFTAGGSVVLKGIPPFLMVGGEPAKPHGINSEGLRRRSFDQETILQLKRGYKLLYKKGLKLDQALTALTDLAAECPEVGQYVDFIRTSKRGIVR